MKWVVNATPRPLYLLVWPGTQCQTCWVCPRVGLDGCRKSRNPPPTGIRSPDRPARGLSLCRLSCPGPTTKGEQLIILPDGATNWCQQVSITGSFQGTRLYQYRVKWSCSCVLYHRMLAHAVCIGGCDASVLNCQAVVFTFRLLCPWERLPVTISCQVGLTPQLDWKQRRRRQILSLLESSVFHLTV